MHHSSIGAGRRSAAASGATVLTAFCWLLIGPVLFAAAEPGPYSRELGDSANGFDAAIPGFTGPHGEGRARLLGFEGTYQNPENRVNPLFVGWASAVVEYGPAPDVAPGWADPDRALGPVSGDNFDIVALGDLTAAQIGNGVAPGQLTLTFDSPIRNFSGADLVIFENGTVSAGGSGVAGEIFGELGYVEVSSDGAQFARFPSHSLTPEAVGAYGTLDPTRIYNLAGKHANASGQSWGTPFDLADLADDPLVSAGLVNIDAITHVRVVDIPGDGTFADALGHPIFDPWVTVGSGGFDLEAVGVISRAMTFDEWQDQRELVGDARGAGIDPGGHGLPNLLQYAFGWVPGGGDPRAPSPAVTLTEGRLEVTFIRDERAVDLIYRVQVSDDLAEWTTIARSEGGGPTVAADGHEPGIRETAAGHRASVGVIRAVAVTDVAEAGARRFMRLEVSEVID